MITNQALTHLSIDPVMRELIANSDKPKNWYGTGNHFLDLIEIITNQQISYKAGKSIFNNILDLIGTDNPTPKIILRKTIPELRTAGLSNSKALYIQEIARAIDSKELDFSIMKTQTDDEIKTHLTKVKGVGPWTSEMFLIFSLNRPDVFSLGDLGLRKAVSRLYAVDEDNTENILKISELWRPYRSTACLYLWQSLDS